ncbi:DUF4192 domain-containing protein [Streptomyces dubilierae]|uniref:DUF4192 domain-containing protein n=1 Tax=Streptomyces dubilierae TaxID=3075533 RepID=A0ABU2PK99_9ACTN|nr:DUF4192 domain-containing protein [Streptomyces sp. DSM 41921]MDT0392582.1 DUF4192 domain-containing protein [Streptomyces sp. DSM 41921]
MTNHGETTGSSENGDIGASGTHSAHPAGARGDGQEKRAGDGAGPRLPGQAYGGHGAEHQVTLRTPAELADALPYLLGYRPEDSIVLVALHDKDGHGRFGGRARLGIPAHEDDWPSAARQLAHGLVKGSERRGARPESMVAFLCQEPEKGLTGRQVMERLRPLAQRLRVECGSLDVVVVEALCISEGRYWSYCCDNPVCCSPEGAPMGLPGTSVLAAAAAYAGIQVRGTLKELRARLQPWETASALQQEAALDAASMALVPRILDEAGRTEVADETLDLAARMLDRLAGTEPVSGMLLADLRDDELIGHDEAARLILGLQDRSTRDRAAEWMEGDEAARALRLWRTLARRCVGPYGEYAAAPLTLAGWVAWSTGDELEAREALAMALAADPDYLFARLLHQACNEGLEPESIRRCLRAERAGRGRAVAAGADVRAEELRGREASSGASAVESVTAETGEAPQGADAEPAPATATARRRRRPRLAGGTPGRTRATDRDPSPRTSHRRTPTAPARPADAAEAATRPGRAASPNSGRSRATRTGSTRARGVHKAVLPSQDTGQDGTRPGPTVEGDE